MKLFLRLFILGVSVVATSSHERAVAQVGGHLLDVRVGKGTTISANGSTSLYLSMPDRGLTRDGQTSMIFVDKSIALTQEGNRLDFIIGVTPMVELELASDVPRLTVEAGIGLNYVSTRELGGRRLGSNILFSPTASAGIELPWMDSLLGIFYMFRHLSNAGIYRDNAGINFQYIVFSMRFQRTP